VLRSTVPPGTSDEVAAQLQNIAEVIYAPEFLRERQRGRRFPQARSHGDRSRVDPCCGCVCNALRAAASTIMLTSRRSAEMIKGASNAFLALKISFCERGLQISATHSARIHSMCCVAWIRPSYRARVSHAGIGFGGPCFEKDLKSLERTATRRMVNCELVSGALRVNERQPKRIVEMLTAELGSLQGRRIGVWGLAFKAGTDDIRDSLAVRILEDLCERGATVLAFDPAVRNATLPPNCTLVASALDAADADALLVLTEWPEIS